MGGRNDVIIPSINKMNNKIILLYVNTQQCLPLAFRNLSENRSVIGAGIFLYSSNIHTILTVEE